MARRQVKRKSRKQSRKQSRRQNKSQRGGVSDYIPTQKSVNGFPMNMKDGGAIVAGPGFVMSAADFSKRSQEFGGFNPTD
jgi:hypothetical protein